MKIYIECEAISEPVGVVKARIDEGINQITLIDLELASRFELKKPDIEKIIGQPITLYVEDIIDDSLHKVRWDGLVYEVIDLVGGKDDNGVYYYTMVMRPPLWMLNYNVHSRSYPGKSRITVVDELLAEHGHKEGIHYEKKYFKTEVYPAFNQLLQTGRSDLSFLKSLLVHAGINYYFGCDDAAENQEMLYLIDNAAFFPTVAGEIPIVRSGGMVQTSRRIETITRLLRAVPAAVKSTAFLSDGSIMPIVKTAAVDKAGTEGEVNLFVPEGLRDPELPAKLATAVASEGFSAARVVHQGIGDHLRLRPGKRLSLKNYDTLDTYQILVTSAHHTFEQSVLAALSESGSGDPSYTNRFLAAEPLAPIRPTDSWTDVDEQMILDAAPDLELHSGASLSPKFKHTPRLAFNPDNDPEMTTEAIKSLMDAVNLLQGQVTRLKQEAADIKRTRPSGGGGVVVAEVTKDAWVTEGKELVCAVKAEEFEDPITVKISVMWHTTGGGTHYLPRKGNHVWIQRVARARDNDWVLVGYRPTAAVSSTNDPAKTTKIKQFT